MKRAQNGQYKAFISSTMNQTLELALKSNKNLIELFKTFQSTPNENPIQALIGLFLNKNQDIQDPNVLTPGRAMEIIQDGLVDAKIQYKNPATMEDQRLLNEHNIKPLDQLTSKNLLEANLSPLPVIDVSQIPLKKRRKEIDEQEVSSL
jgi:hypothetical protein